MTKAEKAALALAPWSRDMTARIEGVDPEDRGLRKFDKYMPTDAAGGERERERTDQTDAFAELLIEFALRMPEGKVPYAYRRQNDGEPDRLDWARLTYLHKAVPSELDFHVDAAGFVASVSPTEALFRRYGVGSRPKGWRALQSDPGQSATNSGIWSQGHAVWLTSFWGWSPEDWGTVGFSAASRLDSVVAETTDPFIMVIYVTRGSKAKEKALRGKVAGFYLVSHVRGHRDEFTGERHHDRDPGKWQHSLKALRAFTFLPEFRLDIDELDPTVGRRALAVAAHAEALDPVRIERLMNIPYVEVPVFGGGEVADPQIKVPASTRTMNRPGPVNRSGYMVAGEPVDTAKELYLLSLEGDTSAFLGWPANGHRIVKVGLSISPQTRREAFARTLPEGAYDWLLHRSTRLDAHEPYPSFEAAVAGETAMKRELGNRGKWLRGEFYVASNSDIEAAWAAGREAALGYRG